MKSMLLGMIVLLMALAGCSSDDSTTLLAPTDTTSPSLVTDLRVIWANESTVNLAWTSVGDDEQTGTAQSYELRMALYPTDPYGWDDWDLITLNGKPLAAGQTQSHAVTGLDQDSVHVFRLVVRDEAGNASEISLPVIATTATQHDSTAPDPITDLTIWSSDGSHLEVSWTASGDDGILGQAASYEVRYSTELITPANWDAATSGATGASTATGERLNADINSLSPDTVYHLAVRMSDEQGNRSLLSNNLVAETVVKNTWYVKPDGTGDMPTVQSAINVAKAGDTIVVAAGTYSWSSQGTDSLGVREWGMLLFKRDVQHIYLRSESGPDVTILDMEGKGRGMYMTGYNDGVVIEGFTFTNGDATKTNYGYGAGGAILMHLTSPVLRNCIFTNNRGTLGGGIANVGQNTAVIIGCRFVNNSGTWGGGYYGANSIPRSFIIDCEFISNKASETGAGAVIDSQAVDITNCLFADNVSEKTGGGIAFYRNHETNLSNCTIVNNHSPTSAAIRLRHRAQINLVHCIVADNTGGAPFFRGDESTFQVSCTNVFGNHLTDAFPPGYDDGGGNTILDPLFIGGDGPDAYDLQAGSPCWAENHPQGACDDMGYQRP